jgi:hypothetical protein
MAVVVTIGWDIEINEHTEPTPFDRVLVLVSHTLLYLLIKL